MTALELLTDLRDRGIKLWVDGSDLRFSAPKGTMNSPAAELLARHKAELVRLLKSASAAEAPSSVRRARVWVKVAPWRLRRRGSRS